METQRYVKELQCEIDHIKSELNRKENTINQIDNILNELFGVTHDVVSKPDEFKKILEEKIKNSKDISNFLPAEPIKVADILINYQRKPDKTESLRLAFANREITEETKVNQFNILQLREIAEYLLVYCNVNRKGENASIGR